MKKYLILFALLAIFTGTTFAQCKRINKLEKENERIEQTNHSLLSDVENYKTVQGLNAVKVGELQLTLKEFRKFRSDDALEIKQLKIKNRELSNLNKISTSTINEVRTVLKDSIVYRDRLVVKELKCIDLAGPYLTVKGCIDSGEFNGTINTYQDLSIAITIKRKRFLGFLWKTKKIKDTHVDIVSSDPNTTITRAEIIRIKL